MKDKRKHERVSKEVKSEVHAIEGMTFSTARDLSTGGIFISTPEPIMVGAEIDLSLHIPGKDSIEIKGIVRWMRDDENDGKKSGMGIEFVDIPGDKLDIVKDLIES